MTKIISGDPAILWEQYSSAGGEAFKNRRYQDAESLWLNALNVAQDISQSEYMLHVSLIRLSLLYSITNKEAEAEELLNWSKRLWELHLQSSRDKNLNH